MIKTIQAKHISDKLFLAALYYHSIQLSVPWHDLEYPQWSIPHWTFTWDLKHYFPQFPEKVILAKARQLIKRGLVDGCTCGCRGDFELTEKGYEYLDVIDPGWFIN